jgi:Rrf2 family nitric oxide-sensitive transcriptional repressor
MQLSVFTDYSLRVLLYATAHDDRLCATAEVASNFDISRHHVVKVVHALQRHGYLETSRGRAGGFRLAQPPERIRVGEVVRRTEGSLALVECFARETSRCPLAPACGIEGMLHEAFDAFFAVLDRTTLADLVSRPRWAARVRLLQPLRRQVGA